MLRNTLFLAAALALVCATGPSGAQPGGKAGGKAGKSSGGTSSGTTGTGTTGTGATSAGTSSKKSSEPGEVEITFANGSLVRMTLLPEKIEIETEYGKLSVPARDVRRIDFGMHMPEGTSAKIDAAIKNLASADFKQRDGAVRDLVALGAYAYPALLQAARSTEPETNKRAQEALAKIKAKVSAKELRLGEYDKVTTPTFTIVGRIITQSIKAKSEYFGETDLALSKLRHLRALIEARESEVAVDAAKYAQPSIWLDTGVMLGHTSVLSVYASGEVELRPTGPGTYVCGPKGYDRNAALLAANGFAPAKAKKAAAASRMYPGTLMGRIGENGDTFVIGDRFEGMLEREGKLYVQIMSSPYDNGCTGSYQVRIGVRE